jgi:hypothetical protein
VIRGRLVLECDAGELEATLEKFAHGPVDFMLEAVEVTASDELLRHDLHPIDAVSVGISVVDREDLPERRTGPLVRLYATRPGSGGLHG